MEPSTSKGVRLSAQLHLIYRGGPFRPSGSALSGLCGIASAALLAAWHGSQI